MKKEQKSLKEKISESPIAIAVISSIISATVTCIVTLQISNARTDALFEVMSDKITADIKLYYQEELMPVLEESIDKKIDDRLDNFEEEFPNI